MNVIYNQCIEIEILHMIVQSVQHILNNVLFSTILFISVYTSIFIALESNKFIFLCTFSEKNNLFTFLFCKLICTLKSNKKKKIFLQYFSKYFYFFLLEFIAYCSEQRVLSLENIFTISIQINFVVSSYI